MDDTIELWMVLAELVFDEVDETTDEELELETKLYP